MTRGPLSDFLQQDHARLDELLRLSDLNQQIDSVAYESFRKGLLRHIAMEEKVLLPEARRLRNGEPLAVASVLRADHAVLAALLIPSPTRELIAQIRAVLVEHNPLEEDPGGLYDLCEQLAGAGAEAILARITALPEVRVARHVDGPHVFENIEALLRARRAARA